MTNEEIREKISDWVSELFDNNATVPKVNSAVEKVVNKVAVLRIKNENVDEKKLLEIFKKISTEL